MLGKRERQSTEPRSYPNTVSGQDRRRQWSAVAGVDGSAIGPVCRNANKPNFRPYRYA